MENPRMLALVRPANMRFQSRKGLKLRWSGEYHRLRDNSNSSRLAVLVVICRINAFSRPGDRSKDQFPTPLPSLIAQETHKPFMQAPLSESWSEVTRPEDEPSQFGRVRPKCWCQDQGPKSGMNGTIAHWDRPPARGIACPDCDQVFAMSHQYT